MSNPLYDQFNNRPTGDMLTQFNRFRQNFRGNPQQMIQQMLNTGQISQDQLNMAMQKANQLKNLFGIK